MNLFIGLTFSTMKEIFMHRCFVYLLLIECLRLEPLAGVGGGTSGRGPARGGRRVDAVSGKQTKVVVSEGTARAI